MRLFASGFFHESVSHQPQSIPLGSFRIFSKIRGDIRKSRYTTGIKDTGSKFATGVSDTGGKFATVSTTPAANFATSSTSVVDTGGKLATRVNDTAGKFAAAVNDTGSNLPPVSATSAANNRNNIRLQIP
jgi:hypothetical protein